MSQHEALTQTDTPQLLGSEELGMRAVSVEHQLLGFKPAETLRTARDRLLRLPGSEHYLAPESGERVDRDTALDGMIEDVYSQTDAILMGPLVAKACRWTADEEAEFDKTYPPLETPFKMPEDLGGRVDVYLQILNYLNLRRQKELETAHTAKSPQKGQAAEAKADATLEMLNGIYMNALYDIGTPFEEAVTDSLWMLDPHEIADETYLPEDKLEVVGRNVNETALETADDTNRLFDEVAGATDNLDLSLISPFLYNYGGSHSARLVMERIHRERTTDASWQADTIRSVWLGELLRASAGINSDTLHASFGLPGQADTISRLEAFIQNSQVIQDVREHLGAEAPDTLAQMDVSGTPTWNLHRALEERARTRRNPDQIIDRSQAVGMLNALRGKFKELFPWGDDLSAHYMTETPTRKGAEKRASQISFYTGTRDERQLVTVAHMSPFAGREFPRTYAHEVGGHGLHAKVLEHAEHMGLACERAWDKVPTAVKEAFATLMDKSFTFDVTEFLPVSQAPANSFEPKISASNQFPDFYTAVVGQVYQALKGAVGDRVRQMLNEHAMTHKPLSQQDVTHILTDATAEAQRLSSLAGIDFEGRASVGALLTTVTMPVDGTVYVAHVLAEPEEVEAVNDEAVEADGEPVQAPAKKPDLYEAFTTRFGTNWLENEGARKLYVSLLYKTSTITDMQELYQLVTAMPETEVNQIYDSLKLDKSIQ